jgi:predicted acylesterase/phospholipase RssA
LRQGAGFERADQSLLLGLAQLRRSSGTRRLAQRPASVPCERLLPAKDRRAADFEPARHLRWLHTTLQQARTLKPSRFELRTISRLAHGCIHALDNPQHGCGSRYSSPGYFDVLANSINIMQDYITRARLAGEPPHVMLVPHLRHIGLMEFSRAKEAIAEGCLCVQQALPVLRRFV